MLTAYSLGKTLMQGKIEGKRRRWWQRTKWLHSITDTMDMNLSKLWEIVEDREAWHAAVHEVTKSRTQLGDWTTTKLWKSNKKYRECMAYCRIPIASCSLDRIKRQHTDRQFTVENAGIQMATKVARKSHRLTQYQVIEIHNLFKLYTITKVANPTSSPSFTGWRKKTVYINKW